MNNNHDMRNMLAMLASIADTHRRAELQWSMTDASMLVRRACAIEARHVLSIVAMLATSERIVGMGELAIPYGYLVNHVCKDSPQRCAVACLSCGLATASDLVPFRM